MPTPTFITRLALSSGAKLLVIGEKWLKDDPYPVGLIINKPEVSEQVTDEEDLVLVEKTPAEYEIWLLPNELSTALFRFYGHAHGHRQGIVATPPSKADLIAVVEKVKNVVCRRVPLEVSAVLFTEEVFGMEDALPIFQEFFASKMDLPDELAPQQAVVRSNGGPSASAG